MTLKGQTAAFFNDSLTINSERGGVAAACFENLYFMTKFLNEGIFFRYYLLVCPNIPIVFFTIQTSFPDICFGT